MRHYYNFILPFLCFSMAVLVSGCRDKKDEPPLPETETPEETKMTVLFYDISSESSMADNYADDMQEVLLGAPLLDLKHFNLLIYSVYPQSSGKMPDLQILEMKDGIAQLTPVKQYDREMFSTDPARIREVIETVTESYPAEKYGLIMAAHGSSWSPKFSDHEVPKVETQAFYSLGGDYYMGIYDWIDIDELAEAIPDHQFEFIWMDACYMSGIEVLYQLRNKCNVYASYPTEVWIEGMPYDEALPYLLQDTPDYKSAAVATFNWYNDANRAVTIGVYDMTKIEPLAEATRALFSNFKPISSAGLLTYSRYSTGPFYEFKEVALKTSTKNNPDLDTSEFMKALDDFTIYADASEKNFRNQLIPRDIYSGLNCHLYREIQSAQDDFYRSLDWYKRIYEQ